MPQQCVVDTGVLMVANGANNGATEGCVARSARALSDLMLTGHVFVDNTGLIVQEYRRNLDAWDGQPGPGAAFFKWLLTNEWAGQKVTRVTITRKDQGPEDFHELPAPPNGITYDPSDRKFLAVAAAYDPHPAILHSLDHKWWGWQPALQAIGVTIHFLCPEEVEAKYLEKTNTA